MKDSPNTKIKQEPQNSNRSIFGTILICIGFLIILSSFVVNEWAGTLWKNGNLVDSKNVLRGYFYSSLLLGAVTVF